MCTDKITKSIVLDKDIIAYKGVHHHPNGGYESKVAPSGRSREDGFSTSGKMFRYKLDIQNESGPPGMYCFRTLKDAQVCHAGPILKVKIPKGSRAYLGIDTYPVILAEKLTPICEV